MEYLSLPKKVVVAAVPAAAGMIAASLTYVVSAQLPLLLLVYFVGCAATSHVMVILWGNAVVRRMAVLGDRPDGAVQQLMLATKRQHETSVWYLKLAGVCLVAWAVLLATR